MDQVTLPRVTVQQTLEALDERYVGALRDKAMDALRAALEQTENPNHQMPEWMDYDPVTDVMTIHGRRYSAAMFGERGFLSPVGTLLQVAEGQPDCVTLMAVPPKEKPEPPPEAQTQGERLAYCAGWSAALHKMREQAEPVAWIDNSGHPKHRLYRQSATERRLYGPLRPLYAAPPTTTTTQQEPK